MNTCLFCGPTEAELTKEELWPKWFSDFMYEHGIRRYTATRTRGRELLSTWQPFVIDSSLYGVCRPCNNETLSDLENDYFKPILTTLCLKAPVRLSIAHQATLIAWITRFAMVADLIYKPKDPFFTAPDRKRFIDTFHAPDDAWIWLFGIQSTNAAGVSCSHLSYKDKSFGLCCTGIIGRVGFQFLIRRWNEPGWSNEQVASIMAPILAKFADATIQLWPVSNEKARWFPPPLYFDAESFNKLARRWGGQVSGIRS